MRKSSLLEELPKTRAEARRLGAPKYFTGKICIRGHVAARYSDGDCCECTKAYTKKYYETNREQVLKRSAAYNQQNPENWYKAHLKRAFGISLDEYRAMVSANAGRCAICGTSDPGSRENKRSLPGWNVDHDHATGVIRGILCRPCNHMLGNAKDSPTRLLAAVDYLDGRSLPPFSMATAMLSFGS